MTTFPALTPSAGRTFTPGSYEHSRLQSVGGLATQVRHSDVITAQRLRLSFKAAPSSWRSQILAHYIDRCGTFATFDLPSQAWVGMPDQTPAGYVWRYAGRPRVVDVGCALYDIDVELLMVRRYVPNVSTGDVFVSVPAMATTTELPVIDAVRDGRAVLPTTLETVSELLAIDATRYGVAALVSALETTSEVQVPRPVGTAVVLLPASMETVSLPLAPMFPQWTPANITTALWLDAEDSGTVSLSGSAVTAWTDKSSAALSFTPDATANRPALVTAAQNSLDAINFVQDADAALTDGLSSRASSIALANGQGAVLVLMVVKRSAAVSSTYRSLMTVRTNVYAGTRIGIYAQSDTSLAFGGRRLDADSYQEVALTSLTLNQYNIIGASFDYTGATLNANFNGTLTARGGGFQTAGNTSSTSPVAVGIGAAPASASAISSTSPFEIAEIVVCHSLANRQKIEGYLAHRWGLTSLLPGGHPYETTWPMG